MGYRCPVCGKEFEKINAMTGHMSVHTREKKKASKKKEMEKKNTINPLLRDFCNQCRWYQEGVCITPKQVPVNWLEELKQSVCSLFESKG